VTEGSPSVTPLASEPGAPLSRVSYGGDVTGDLDAFYRATYPRLVGELVLLTGDREEAQDVAQEAFARLCPRWERIRTYDAPEAWVRTVAIRLAVSRWRRARVAVAGALRMAAPRPLPGPSDELDVVAALAALPLPQREVVVLHHVAGMPVDEIAERLGAPVGTVKSRLARGRAALAEQLAIEEVGRA